MKPQLGDSEKAYVHGTQRCTLNVTPWLDWLLACLLRAVQGADGLRAGVLRKLEGGGRSTGYELCEK